MFSNVYYGRAYLDAFEQGASGLIQTDGRHLQQLA